VRPRGFERCTAIFGASFSGLFWALQARCGIASNWKERTEGMGAEENRKKTKIIPGTQSKARAIRMAQTPQAGTGDSVSRFRRYHCSTVMNFDSYFPVGEQFCLQLLFTT